MSREGHREWGVRNRFWLVSDRVTEKTWTGLTSTAKPMAEVKGLSLKRERKGEDRGEKTRRPEPQVFHKEGNDKNGILTSARKVSQRSLEAMKQQVCGYRTRELVGLVLSDQRGLDLNRPRVLVATVGGNGSSGLQYTNLCACTFCGARSIHAHTRVI